MHNYPLKQILLTLLLSTYLTTIRAQITIDTAKYVLFQHDNVVDKWIFDKKYKPYSLTESDVAEVESILLNCVYKYNLSQTREFNRLNKKEPGYFDLKSFIIDLPKYKRQLVAVINSKGEKEVWVNCFRESNYKIKYWREKIVMASDGGNYFFNVKINLTTKKYHEFRVNGF